jgi:hypothetical protein
MELIISAIVGWITSNILNKIFKREKNNQEIIKLRSELLRQLEEKDHQIIKLTDEQKDIIKEKQRMIDSIKRSGLSTEKLINRYGKGLNAILISCYNQKSPSDTIYGTPEKFLLKELERFNGKHLGSGVYLIPPASMPKNIHNRNDLEQWFETEILKGRYCILKFLIVFDLNKKAYWKNYLPYKQKKELSHTLGDVLDVEDLFTEEQIKTTTIDNIIKSGDIGWLAYNYLSESEFQIIRNNQNAIEKALGNPSLRLLTNESMKDKISSVLSRYSIDNSHDIAEAIISEAKFWQLKLSEKKN